LSKSLALPFAWRLAMTFASASTLALGILASCKNDSRDRSDAGHVLRALEAVRSAPNEYKRRPADELAQVPCGSPIVCGARDNCAEAYQHLVRGTEAALRVKNALDHLEADPVLAESKKPELAAELERADREIGGAKDSLQRCEEAASLMRHTFGI
jgi:hypothetical protein